MIRFFKKYKNLIPIILLGITCLFTTYTILFKEDITLGYVYLYRFSLGNYLAFLTIILDVLIFFKWRKYFKYAVVLTFFLELFGIINYLYFDTVTTIIIPFQGLSLLVAFLYFILNLNRIRFKLKITDDTTIDYQKVEKFKDKYIEETDDDLLNIINDQRYTQEAKLAAQEIVQSRK